MSRVIGLDMGKKRIGVAISDETKTIARGLETIAAGNIHDTIGRIELIVKQYNADAVVIGLPLNMDGSSGGAVKMVCQFKEILEKHLSIDVLTFDERLTSKQGEAILLEADMSREKRKARIDKFAAQILLQSYLDSKKG